MIIIIGSEDEVMGFGLGGVDDAHIVSGQTSKEDVASILSNYGQNDVVLVSIRYMVCTLKRRRYACVFQTTKKMLRWIT